MSSLDLLRRMVTQEFSAAVNNGFATGNSTLSTPIDLTLPYFINFWGSRFSSTASTANPGVIEGMTDSDTVHCSRSSGSTTGDVAVYGSVTGVPL